MRVWRLDRPAVLDRLKAWASSLAGHGAIAVVLFGSLARGDQTAASDADVLVILEESSLPFRDRISAFSPSRLGLSVDVFPYTLEEARSAWRQGSGVVPIALREGLFLAGERNRLLAMLGAPRPADT